MPTQPTYDLATLGADVNTNLAQNAYLIGDAIYTKTLNTAKWDAMIPKTTLPTGVGEALTSLIYDASLPTIAENGTDVGLNWKSKATELLTARALNTTTDEQMIIGAGVGTLSANDAMSFVKFTKVLRDYGLNFTHIISPWFDVNDFRTAANVVKQVAALTKAMSGTVKWGWERWFQEGYEKMCGNYVGCLSASTLIQSDIDIGDSFIDPATGAADDGDNTLNNPFYRVPLVNLQFGTGITLPDAYVSNKIMDRIWNRLSILTPPEEAYGMDNGAPIFCAVMSTDASYALKTESGNRDDVRKSSMVDSLIKPLGISESFRGFYHMTLPDMPRFTSNGTVLTRIEPLTSTGAYNTAYDTATYEAIYIVHKEVMEGQVPNPNVSAPGVTFDPISYRGDWKWVNNKDNVNNRLGDKGYFLGTLACANKPKNIEYGYVVLFKRTVTTLAA